MLNPARPLTWAAAGCHSARHRAGKNSRIRPRDRNMSSHEFEFAPQFPWRAVIDGARGRKRS